MYYGEVQKHVWHVTPLSSNLGDFLLGIADYVRLYVVDYNGSIHNEDGVLVTTFWNDFAALLDQHPGTAGRTQAWLRTRLKRDMARGSHAAARKHGCRTPKCGTLALFMQTPSCLFGQLFRQLLSGWLGY
ncbi:MAG: hypothetical protein MI924_26325 [Chloroflexales bacterium]|nr:hypothetical protein [Chloroflexales bacterium]